jgi:hypothetical protein
MSNDKTVEINGSQPTPVSADTRSHKLSKPRDINYWLIPTAALITAALWAASAANIATDDGSPNSFVDGLLVGTTCISTAITILYCKDYLLHRAMTQDHAHLQAQMERLHGEYLDLRARTVVAAAEQRAMLEQISVKLNRLGELYWQNYAGELVDKASGGNVLPFGPRRQP